MVTDAICEIEPVAYAVGLTPGEFWPMTFAEAMTVIRARIPKQQDENTEEESMLQTPDEMAEVLRMLTLSLGGKVIVKDGSRV